MLRIEDEDVAVFCKGILLGGDGVDRAMSATDLSASDDSATDEDATESATDDSANDELSPATLACRLRNETRFECS